MTLRQDGTCENDCATPTPAPMVYLRVGSHRAARRLEQLLGPLDWHYTMETGGELVPCPASMVDQARAIPSVTRARLTSEPRKCWSTL